MSSSSSVNGNISAADTSSHNGDALRGDVESNAIMPNIIEQQEPDNPNSNVLVIPDIDVMVPEPVLQAYSTAAIPAQDVVALDGATSGTAAAAAATEADGNDDDDDDERSIVGEDLPSYKDQCNVHNEESNLLNSWNNSSSKEMASIHSKSDSNRLLSVPGFPLQNSFQNSFQNSDPNMLMLFNDHKMIDPNIVVTRQNGIVVVTRDESNRDLTASNNFGTKNTNGLNSDTNNTNNNNNSNNLNDSSVYRSHDSLSSTKIRGLLNDESTSEQVGAFRIAGPGADVDNEDESDHILFDPTDGAAIEGITETNEALDAVLVEPNSVIGNNSNNTLMNQVGINNITSDINEPSESHPLNDNTTTNNNIDSKKDNNKTEHSHMALKRALIYIVPCIFIGILVTLYVTLVFNNDNDDDTNKDNNTNNPDSSNGTGTNIGIKCFESPEELRLAVSIYIDGASVDTNNSIKENKTTIKDRYGQTMADWCVDNIQDFSLLFSCGQEADLCSSFNENITLWNTSSARTMASMFANAISFNRDISTWDVSSVTDMSYMFANATSFNQSSILTEWNVAAVTNMSHMFSNAQSFDDSSIMTTNASGWDTSSVINMEGMFENSVSFVGSTTAKWDVSAVTTMNNMFAVAGMFNGNISSWRVSNVGSMDAMFNGATAFNQDLSSWDVSSVTKMNLMFNGAVNFNRPLNTWNVSKVVEMNSMFKGAASFSQDLNNWDVSSVRIMSSMFASAQLFNGTMSSWDVSNVQDMNFMFENATSFNANITLWNVSNVGTVQDGGMGAMFAYTPFNYDISNWNVSNVKVMRGMFAATTNFNQSLCSWGPKIDLSSKGDNQTTPLTDVFRMFILATNCPTQTDPNLMATPSGPFCHVCS